VTSLLFSWYTVFVVLIKMLQSIYSIMHA